MLRSLRPGSTIVRVTPVLALLLAAPGVPAQVTLSPSGGTYSSPMRSVTISWCEPIGSILDPNSRSIYLNGTNVTWTFTYVRGTHSGCGTYATSTGTVALTPGQNTVTAYIMDVNENVSTGAATYTSTAHMVVNLNYTNNDNQNLALCANSCFAATYAQSTVPYFSLDAPRNVTLAYHGDRVAVRPLVYADISLTQGAPTVQEYWLQVQDSTGTYMTFVNGDTKLRFAPGVQPRAIFELRSLTMRSFV